jgi:hypothetical protein
MAQYKSHWPSQKRVRPEQPPGEVRVTTTTVLTRLNALEAAASTAGIRFEFDVRSELTRVTDMVCGRSILDAARLRNSFINTGKPALRSVLRIWKKRLQQSEGHYAPTNRPRS